VAIVFGKRDLNAVTHEMFKNELGRIPPSTIWFIELLTRHSIEILNDMKN
jgi:hypothetical protein